MYLVAAFIISSSVFSKILGSRPPCNTTFFNFSFAHFGSISGSILIPSGLTNSLNFLYLSFIPLGKQMLDIFSFLQNSTIFALGE